MLRFWTESSYSYAFCGGWISLCSVSPSNSLFFLLSVSYGNFSLTMVSQSNILYPRRPLMQQHCGPGWLDWYFHILWKLNNGCSVVGVYWWENVSGFFKNLSSHTNFPLAYPSVASFYMQQTVFSANLMQCLCWVGHGLTREEKTSKSTFKQLKTTSMRHLISG